MKVFLAVMGIVVASGAFAFAKVPRDSAQALGVTKGKPFGEGVVFVNGKYLPPPYTVERWGTGLRINGRKVSGQVIDWSEFLKTQSGVKVTRQVEKTSVETKKVELAPEPGADESNDLDDLFDDDESTKKKKKSVRKPTVVRKSAPAERTTTSYSLDGAFVPNEASKALLARINATRNEIDRNLRLGGFVFFGDAYSRVSGEVRTTVRLMDVLPEAMRQSENLQAFKAAIRAAGLSFLPDQVCEDLYRNRIDYHVLQRRAQDIKASRELNRALSGSGISSF